MDSYIFTTTYSKEKLAKIVKFTCKKQRIINYIILCTMIIFAISYFVFGLLQKNDALLILTIFFILIALLSSINLYRISPFSVKQNY